MTATDVSVSADGMSAGPREGHTTITAGRSAGHAARSVVGFSLAVTAASGVVAAVLHYAAGEKFLLAFVLLRWSVVAVLVASPLMHRLVLVRLGLGLPYVLRTPLTALLLTGESIVVDIICAHV
jgi:hypothetical protein